MPLQPFVPNDDAYQQRPLIRTQGVEPEHRTTANAVQLSSLLAHSGVPDFLVVNRNTKNGVGISPDRVAEEKDL
jgi:hypothetical protein